MFRSVRLWLPCLLLLTSGAMVPVHAQSRPGEARLIRQVAAATGKSPASLRALLAGAEKKQSIIDTMNRPAESKPWPDYRRIFMTSARIHGGIAFARKHRALLDRIGRKYGVPPAYLVAIVGVETNYGRQTGGYRVLDALVTLAFYYPSRAHYFRAELKTLLELPQDKLGGPLDSLKGSYAGAQGWGQFMPSSIKDYAVDADHDGRIDLSGSLPDILASVANYLHDHGWQKGEPVAVRAQVGSSARSVKVEHSKPLYPVSKWKSWGYTAEDKTDPARMSTLLRLGDDNHTADWLTFHNFEVITRYNRSPMYAMVVHQLAQAIAAGTADASRGAWAAGTVRPASAPARSNFPPILDP